MVVFERGRRGVNFTQMKIITENIPIIELQNIARDTFGNLVKAVVDVEKQIMAVGGELHSDEEALLLENGSRQQDLWGINIYPEIQTQDWIEFDSMINLRPSQNNMIRGISDPKIQKKIIDTVNELIQR